MSGYTTSSTAYATGSTPVWYSLIITRQVGVSAGLITGPFYSNFLQVAPLLTTGTYSGSYTITALLPPNQFSASTTLNLTEVVTPSVSNGGAPLTVQALLELYFTSTIPVSWSVVTNDVYTGGSLTSATTVYDWTMWTAWTLNRIHTLVGGTIDVSWSNGLVTTPQQIACTTGTASNVSIGTGTGLSGQKNNLVDASGNAVSALGNPTIYVNGVAATFGFSSGDWIFPNGVIPGGSNNSVAPGSSPFIIEWVGTGPASGAAITWSGSYYEYTSLDPSFHGTPSAPTSINLSETVTPSVSNSGNPLTVQALLDLYGVTAANTLPSTTVSNTTFTVTYTP